MGLQEKRAIKEFQDSKLPGLLKEIQAFVSCPVEVDWDSLAASDGADISYWAEFWEKVYFKPIIDGFKEIAVDTMGQEALKGGVKKIELCNKGDHYGADAITFNSGVLKIDHKPFTNVDDVDDRRNYIVKVISQAL